MHTDHDATTQPRERDPIMLNVFCKNKSAIYQAVSSEEMSNKLQGEGENICNEVV